MLLISKSVDKAYAGLESQLQYTVEVMNTGIQTLTDIVLTDSLPSGTTLIAGSVVVEGITLVGANLQTGITLPNLIAGDTLPILVEFQTQVIDKPLINPMQNMAIVNFLQQGDTVPYTATSNITSTQVNYPSFENTFQLNRDTLTVDIGNTVTYTIELTNTGNVEAINTKLVDLIPAGMMMVANSIVIDGTTLGNPNFISEINLGTIVVGGSRQVSFQAQATGVPFNPVIMNSVTLVYGYIINPTTPEHITTTSIGSNTVSVNVIPVKANIGNTSVAVNQSNPPVGGVVTYTITIPNTGLQDAIDVTVLNELIPGLALIGTPTVVGNIGVVTGNLTIAPGLNIGTIRALEEAIITFQIKIEQQTIASMMSKVVIQSNDTFVNTTTITYTDLDGIHTLSQIGGTLQLGRQNSADLGETTKQSSMTSPQVGEGVTYTINIPNKGPGIAQNVFVYDELVEEIKLIEIVSIVGSTGPIGGKLDEMPGLGIGDILVGETAELTFNVAVQGIPLTNPFENQVSITYSDEIGELSQMVTGGYLQVDENAGANLVDAMLQVSEVDAKVGDILTYRSTLPNTGFITAEQVQVIGRIVPELSLVPNSTQVNGATGPIVGDITQGAGLSIGSVLAGEIAEIIFELQVDAVPEGGMFTNQLQIKYTDEYGKVGQVITPQVTTNIKIPNGPIFETSTKQSNIQEAGLGVTIVYTISAINTGDQTAQGLKILDILPQGMTYVEGSATVDGVTLPVTGNIELEIGEVQIGETKVIRFEAVVTGVITPSQYTNKIKMLYEGPTGIHYTEELEAGNSIDVSTGYIDNTDIQLISSKTVAIIGEEIMFTLMLKNSGNLPIEESSIGSLIPVGTSYVEESFVINGVTQVGVDPVGGVTLPILNPQETIQIVWRVKIQENPPALIVTGGILTYLPTVQSPIQTVVLPQLTIQTIDVNIQMIKSVSKEVVAVGDTITFNIRIENKGTYDVNEVTVYDLLNEVLDFVEGSVVIDSVTYPKANILTGVTIKSIRVGDVVNLSFDTKVVRKTADTVTNIASGTIRFIAQPVGGQQLGTQGISAQVYDQLIAVLSSNPINLVVQNPNLSIVSEIDQENVSKDEIVNVLVTLTNTGDTLIADAIVKGWVSEGAIILSDSFWLDGIKVNDVDLAMGMNVGAFNVGESKRIVYQLKVVGGTASGKITNTIYAEYIYTLVDQTAGSAITPLSEQTFSVNISSFKQVIYNRSYKLDDCHPGIEELDEVLVELKFIDSYTVDTPKLKSIERQELTGKKLIVHGEIEIGVTYTADEKVQPIHSVQWIAPISDFVILPLGYEEGQNIQLRAIVEEVEAMDQDSRTIDIMVVMLIIAQVTC